MKYLEAIGGALIFIVVAYAVLVMLFCLWVLA
jgi:hypothetical protein